MSSGYYEHRQATLVFVVLVTAIFIAAGLRATADNLTATIVLAAIGVVVIGTIAGVSALHTTVTERELVAAFRFGWPARRIELASITSHQPVRNSWWWGFGVRLVPTGGWMYNVWGLDAVEVRYTDARDTEQIFRIGTNDPDGLDAALQTAVNRRS